MNPKELLETNKKNVLKNKETFFVPYALPGPSVLGALFR